MAKDDEIDKQLGFSFYKFVYVYAFTIFQMQKKQWIIRCYIFVNKRLNSCITIYTICWAIFYPRQNMIMFISSIMKFYYKIKIINFTKDGWILSQKVMKCSHSMIIITCTCNWIKLDKIYEMFRFKFIKKFGISI
jgi:hypothetical protein